LLYILYCIIYFLDGNPLARSVCQLDGTWEKATWTSCDTSLSVIWQSIYQN